MKSKNALMRKLQEYSFAAHDAALFLDINPDSTKALAYFKKMKALEEKATREYESLYGPLTVNAQVDYDRWVWAQTPFPWELEG